ncbi:MAG: SMP-30/gluconolactonase/LRE family protein [Mariniphaga sp.]|nr:SMP-30/gluconolactonase/LRE family protein [Mariniphaga sp.]
MNNNVIKTIILFFILIVIIGCNSKQTKVIEIEYDKAIIPEGIAINSENGKLYLSSLHKEKIVEYDLKNKKAEDLTTSKEYGFKSGVGMIVKDNKLFALSGDMTKIQSSILVVIDLETNELLHSYTVNDTVSHFMNDLTISENNQIYITDTRRHIVYKLDYPSGEIENFMIDDQIKYPNGISISENGEKLFVDSNTEGIRIIDIDSKKILNKKNDYTSNSGVDGLKYYKGNLYAVRNFGDDNNQHGFIKLVLSKNQEEIVEVVPVLLGHEKLNVPTTFDIFKDYAYFIANSQMKNLDQEKNQIINPDSLTNTFIIKVRL